MLEKSDNKVNDQERKKAEYTVRVRDYLTQVMQYRDCLTRYPKAPEPNTKLYAANMEFIVYCNDGSEVIPEQLCEAYQVIMTYRFPMRLNPLNAPKIEALPAEEKALLYRDEAEFILMKIRNINPAFCINTIPKSLYQLLFFIASETERQAAFKKNQSFFTTPNRDNYVSIENTPNDDDNNSVTNINRPVFGFGFHAKKAFTNPNDTDNYFQHCITYLGCHIVTQEWYNTNMFILELLVKRGLLGVDFSPNQLRGLSNWAYDFIANNTLLNRHRASFMSTVGSRCDLFNHEEKRNYLQDLANTLILREWNLRKIRVLAKSCR
ncbi:MAG: hypothetical protein EPN84_01830 [Legionella sp.]|nr:MAG: hypothetical protein EPN84_01830 [Legionella sp.]